MLAGLGVERWKGCWVMEEEEEERRGRRGRRYRVVQGGWLAVSVVLEWKRRQSSEKQEFKIRSTLLSLLDRTQPSQGVIS